MHTALLEKAARCRKEAVRCFTFGKAQFARRWIELGKGFCHTAANSRTVFRQFGDDKPLP